MRFLGALLVAVLLQGCAASQIDRARQSVTVGVNLFSGGVKALDTADQATQSALIAKVKAGTMSPEAANAEYAAWGVKYEIAMKALQGLWGALRTTADVAAAADAKLQADIPGALASLAKALGDVVAALNAMGIKLPGVAP